MPKFFIPEASGHEQEQVYKQIRNFVQDVTGWELTDRRIFRLDYTYRGRPATEEIDRTVAGVGEAAFVILEAVDGPYLICTPSRGVLRGSPVMVGRAETRRVIEFNEQS